MTELLNNPNTGKYFVLLTILIFGAMETFGGHYKNTNRSKDDWIVEWGGFLLVSISSFIALYGVIYLGQLVFPDSFNAFTIWDQLFGTATFTRKYPLEFGLQTDPKDGWAPHLFYPFITSKKEGSEIAKDFKRTSTATLDAMTVDLEAGAHLWCQCGFSKNAPFCDGAHHGTKIKPIAFEVKKKRKVKLCNCKQTKTGPFCDNTHLELDKSSLPMVGQKKSLVLTKKEQVQ